MAATASRVKSSLGRSPGDTHARGDVRGGLLEIERGQLAAKGDALLQLTQAVFVQPARKLGLPGQNHRERLAARALHVGQQSNLLEQFVRKALRFVHDEGDNGADSRTTPGRPRARPGTVSSTATPRG